MGANVWRVGRTAEDRLMYERSVRKRISEREEQSENNVDIKVILDTPSRLLLLT